MRGVGSVVLGLGLGLGGCQAPAPAPTRSDAREPEIRAVEPSSEPSERRHLALVTPRFTVEVGSAVDGRLAEVAVGLGERVEAGDSLASLDGASVQAELRLAEASVRSARGHVARARSARELHRGRARRTESLGDHVSRDEHDQRQHERREADAAAASARGDLDVELARIDILRARLDALTLRAPFAAEVAAIHHDPGQSVTSGEPVVRLVSVERIVRFAVEADQFGELALGSTVAFSCEAPEVSASARVVALAPEVDAAGMILVEAVLLDDHDPELRTGTRGYVRTGSAAETRSRPRTPNNEQRTKQ